jgi:DHA1 family tetracycline resistance protein-like MFS transporter
MQSRPASIAALVGVVFIGMTGFGIFLPIFPFLALEVGASPSATTIAMGAYSLGQLISSPFWGRLSDRVGRKPILIVGLVGGVISYLWLAQASNVYELGAARLFGGLMAGNVAAAFAAAADLANDKTRARNMGLLGAAVGVGFIAGPAIGALLVGDEPTRAGYALVCYAAAGLALAAAITAVFFFRESLVAAPAQPASDQPRSLAFLLSRPVLARFIAIMLMVMLAQAMMETTLGLWADARLEWGPRELGWALTGFGVGAALLQGGAAGRIAALLGERLMLTIGLAVLIGGLAGLGVAASTGAAIAAFTAMVVGSGLAGPALNSLVASEADADRGAAMGLSQSAGALGRVIGPLMAGPLFEFVGVSAPFLAGALALLVALFLVNSLPPPRESAAPV